MSAAGSYTRNQRAITHALMSLLKLKPFEKITVQDILDATPVTRSTFYKHFHDKYEIVEQMQEYYLSNQYQIRNLILTNPRSAELQEAFLANQELLNALLKVHTEKVDIRQALADQAESYYRDNVNSPNSEVEAQVYAHALTAFQLSNYRKNNFNFDYMDDIFISSMLMLLGIPGDEDVIRLLHKKMAGKPSRQPE